MFDTFNRTYTCRLKGAVSHSVELGSNSLGNIVRITNRLKNLRNDLENFKLNLESVTNELNSAKIEVEKPFEKKQELDDLYKKVALGLVAYAVYRAAKKSYNNWRMNRFMSGKQWENVKVKVANILGKAESFVEKLVNDHIKTIYAAGYNTTLFDFETGTLVDTTLPIYTQLSIQYILKNNFRNF